MTDVIADTITPMPLNPAKEVIFIDAAVSDWRTLIADINPGIPAILLPSDGNGLQAIADALKNFGTLDTIHLVSHGGSGYINLGSLHLDENVLSAQQGALQSIAAHLTDHSDVLIYGCSVAAGETGVNFVNNLSTSLNNADIAASINRTGPAALGGDWNLEFADGVIESVLPFTVQGMQGIDECLGCVQIGDGWYLTAAGNRLGTCSPPPSVSNIAITSATGVLNSTLDAGDIVSVTVTMSVATTVTGTPKLAINIGGFTVQASYASGSGSSSLVFNYTILAGQNDTDGISIDADRLTLNDGTLKDAAGNNAILNHSAVASNSSYMVDTPPIVKSVAITSATGAQSGNLNAGDTVNATVTMSEATTVTGTPQLTLNIGDTVVPATAVQATYASGSGTTTLVFNYTILAGQTDANGISINANSLALNSGTLQDAAGNNATLTHVAVASNSNYRIDTTSPTVSRVRIGLASGTANNTLNADDRLRIDVTMSEATTVTGTPQLALNIGGTTVPVNYTGGSTTTALSFVYTILAGQTDTDGISINANSLTLNGGTLTDAAGNNATLTHSAVTDNASYKVDTTAPTVSGIAITSATGIQNSTLNAGDIVSVTVTMSEATTVTGTPQLALNIGGTTVQARYASGSNSSALVFSYTLLAGQTDTDGISINADSLTLNSGTLKDAALNNATLLTHSAVTDNASYKVDTLSPLNTVPTAQSWLINNTLTFSNGNLISVAESFGNVTTVVSAGAGTITATTGGSATITSNGSSSVSISGTATQVNAALAGMTYTYGTAGNQTLTITSTDDAGNVDTDTVAITLAAPDTSSTITASATLTEPSTFATTVASSGTATGLLDFTISDAGTSDGFATTVTSFSVDVSGTTSNTERGSMVFLLNGSDASNVQGTYDSSTHKITFSGLNISVANGANETYTISGYYNDSTSSNDITDGHTLLLTLNASGFTTGTGSSMAASQTSVTNGSGAAIDVTATQLVYSQAPSGSITSGFAFTTQPIVQAVDARGNVDTGYSGNITLSENSSGTLGGTLTVAASSGVATFSGVQYIAASDADANFTLTAASGSLTSATVANLNPDVVATRLIFDTQPAPTNIISGTTTTLTTAPVIKAVDANNLVDTHWNSNILLFVTNTSGGAVSGTVNGLSVTSGDQDLASSTVTLIPSNGVATFTGLALQYTNSGGTYTVKLLATSSSLTAAASSDIVSYIAPSVSSVVHTGGASNITNADSVTWRVTTSMPVSHVDSTDFDITGLTGETISVTANSSTEYDVTVTGGGLATLDGTVTLALAAGQNIQSTAGAVTLGSLTPTGTDERTYTIDNTAPGAPTTIIDLAAASDSFTSPGTNSDDLTKTTNPTVRVALAGTSAVAGDTLELLLGGASLPHAAPRVLQAADITAGYYDFTITAGDLGADGNKTLTARVTDIAGNVGSAGSAFTLRLDTTAPVISAISVPDVTMKVGSTVTASLIVSDDGGTAYVLNASTIDGFSLSNLQRVDSTHYPAQFTVTTGGNDVAAAGNIPVSLSLSDIAGNTSTT